MKISSIDVLYTYGRKYFVMISHMIDLARAWQCEDLATKFAM